MLQRTLVPSFFLSFFFFYLPFLYLANLHVNDQFKSVQKHSNLTVWAGIVVHGCGRVCGCVWVGVFKCMWVQMGVHQCVWNEFSEYLLETRVLTSADFNTYSIRIFFTQFVIAIYFSFHLEHCTELCCNVFINCSKSFHMFGQLNIFFIIYCCRRIENFLLTF